MACSPRRTAGFELMWTRDAGIAAALNHPPACICCTALAASTDSANKRTRTTSSFSNARSFGPQLRYILAYLYCPTSSARPFRHSAVVTPNRTDRGQAGVTHPTASRPTCKGQVVPGVSSGAHLSSRFPVLGVWGWLLGVPSLGRHAHALPPGPGAVRFVVVCFLRDTSPCSRPLLNSVNPSHQLPRTLPARLVLCRGGISSVPPLFVCWTRRLRFALRFPDLLLSPRLSQLPF